MFITTFCIKVKCKWRNKTWNWEIRKCSNCSLSLSILTFLPLLHELHIGVNDMIMTHLSRICRHFPFFCFSLCWITWNNFVHFNSTFRAQLLLFPFPFQAQSLVYSLIKLALTLLKQIHNLHFLLMSNHDVGPELGIGIFFGDTLILYSFYAYTLFQGCSCYFYSKVQYIWGTSSKGKKIICTIFHAECFLNQLFLHNEY